MWLLYTEASSCSSRQGSLYSSASHFLAEYIHCWQIISSFKIITIMLYHSASLLTSSSTLTNKGLTLLNALYVYMFVEVNPSSASQLWWLSHLQWRSADPAASRTLLGCQSRLRTVERTDFLMCLLSHLQGSEHHDELCVREEETHGASTVLSDSLV